MVTSEEDSTASRRSSSQTSRLSNDSRKSKTAANQLRRSLSKASTTTSQYRDSSLTSFPSISPEQAVTQQRGPKNTATPKPSRTVSQKFRERRATLAGLTSASPSIAHNNALFDDVPRSSIDVPGALHLASDDHISRLVSRAGAVKLVRQFAQDLAQRDAEITSLRMRADNRERELKRLLRDAHVSSAEIERSLLRLEQSPDAAPGGEGSPTSIGRKLDGLIQDAILADLPIQTSNEELISPSLPDEAQIGRPGSVSRQPISTVVSSRMTSRTSSVTSQSGQDTDKTVKPRASSSKGGRMRGLETIFQPPATSYFIGGAIKTGKKSTAADAASVRSNQSASSFASWTKLFGGNAQLRKDDAPRPRSSSIEHEADLPESGQSIISKTHTTPNVLFSKSTSSLASTGTVKARPTSATATRLSTSPTQARKDSNASDAPPTVEMDSMIESSQLPPTMSTYNHDAEGLLTDRFGFIFDKRQRKRQSIAMLHHRKNRLSGAETLGSFRSDEDVASQGEDAEPPKRSTTPLSVDEDPSSWKDYLKVSSNANLGRPRELLSHTPSAGAVVTVNTAPATGTITPPSKSHTTNSAADHRMFQSHNLRSDTSQTAVAAISDPAPEGAKSDTQVNLQEPVRLLLDQLKELHDSLQAEKTLKWNAFLRVHAPEADMLNGELIGIASLGRSNRTKSKYLAFKNLVLGGIPVALRPKIWAECSGANMLRIPGYYDDLVARSEEGSDIDPDISSQIFADVRRTLKDNVYFRHGPGVQRLTELLRAYAIHNKRIGYCQGENLIGAALLLICATTEDCFWLLVAIIDKILPSGYFDASLLVARADQIVLREYVAEVLPNLDRKLQELGVELEACTFHWFLSLYTGVLTGGEALYRIWDVVLCLNSSDATPNTLNASKGLSIDVPGLGQPAASVMAATAEDQPSEEEHDGTSSPFLFQLSLALLKLNESAILELDSLATVYSYIGTNMTNHAISIDALVQAAEALRTRIKRSDVLERRKRAVEELSGVRRNSAE